MRAMSFDLSLINPALSLSGLVVGIIVGLTGVGGGSLMTPLLILFFGFKPAPTCFMPPSPRRGAVGCIASMAMSTGASPGAWPWAVCPPQRLPSAY